MFKVKSKRLVALLKLNIIEGFGNGEAIKKLFNELVTEGYPKGLLVAKMKMKKEEFLQEKDLNDILVGVERFTPSELEQIEGFRLEDRYFKEA